MADNRSGIYHIVHIASGREYVGSAVNFSGRWSVHKSELNTQTHHSRYLQHVYNKYGLDSLKFETIEIVDDLNRLIDREQYWLDLLEPVFNTAKIAGNTLGVPCSPATRAKISAANTGRTGWRHTIETKELLRLSKLGNQHTKGRVMPEDERIRRGLSQKRKVLSPETKAKISESHKGKPGRIWTDQEREKVAASKRGKPRPPHVVEAMNLGRKIKRALNADEFLAEST